jgi:antirestriction protein ArdC
MHWTAPAHRCNRDLSGRFGSDAYALEELVAELGAAFLSLSLGSRLSRDRTMGNIWRNWLTVLKGRQAGRLCGRVESCRSCSVS